MLKKSMDMHHRNHHSTIHTLTSHASKVRLTTLNQRMREAGASCRYASLTERKRPSLSPGKAKYVFSNLWANKYFISCQKQALSKQILHLITSKVLGMYDLWYTALLRKSTIGTYLPTYRTHSRHFTQSYIDLTYAFRFKTSQPHQCQC